MLDTDVMVAAMRSRTGASAALLRRVRDGQVEAVATVALALEYEMICQRPEHQVASGYTRAEVVAFVDAVIAMMEPVRNHFHWRPQLRDPDYEHVLEAAINGRAGVLVTFNIKDFGDAARFGIEVMRPGDALRRLNQ